MMGKIKMTHLQDGATGAVQPSDSLRAGVSVISIHSKGHTSKAIGQKNIFFYDCKVGSSF